MKNVSKAKIFAQNLDDATKKQFEECISQDFVIKGALMPDAHYGYVAPIGSVIVTKKMIVPSWVGYDIGCGVIATKLKGKNILEKIKAKRKEIYEKVNKEVPMGLGNLNAEHKINKETKEEYKKILAKLEKGPHDEELFKWIKRKALSNIGSLGHGNHFIEMSENKKEAWLIIHTGSRNVGHHVAGFYMKKAQEVFSKGIIQGSVEQTFPIDSSTELGKEYLAVLDFCLELALINRKEIIKKVMKNISEVIGEEIKYELWVNKNHNHAERIGKSDKFIHRKGATPSKNGERGVIPGNMRDGSFLVIGKGNKDFLESSTHGAGRAMSKSQAKREISMEKFAESMKGITATIEVGTIDESPFAYKNIYEVMLAQKESVKIYKHLKPIINWKGKEQTK